MAVQSILALLFSVPPSSIKSGALPRVSIQKMSTSKWFFWTLECKYGPKPKTKSLHKLKTLCKWKQNLPRQECCPSLILLKKKWIWIHLSVAKYCCFFFPPRKYSIQISRVLSEPDLCNPSSLRDFFPSRHQYHPWWVTVHKM